VLWSCITHIFVNFNTAVPTFKVLIVRNMEATSTTALPRMYLSPRCCNVHAVFGWFWRGCEWSIKQATYHSIPEETKLWLHFSVPGFDLRTFKVTAKCTLTRIINKMLRS
jgi:hypothetical protein